MSGIAGSDCRIAPNVTLTPWSPWPTGPLFSLTPVIAAIDALISSNVCTPIFDAGGKSIGVGGVGVGGGGRLNVFAAILSNVRKNSSDVGPFWSGSTAPRSVRRSPASAVYALEIFFVRLAYD